MESDARIFVTGASGFIGTSLVRQILAAGYRVRGMNRKAPVFPFLYLKFPGVFPRRTKQSLPFREGLYHNG